MHKMKKKTKSKLVKGSLCLALGLFLLLASYKETKIKKDNIELLSINDTNIFTNVDNEELMDILNNGSGVVLIVNSKTMVNKYVSLLYDTNKDSDIYVYNVKNEERILKLNENNEIEEVQKPTKFYKKLLSYLGLYTEPYVLSNSLGDTIKTNYNTIITPSVLFVKDGSVLLSHTLVTEELEDQDLMKVYTLGYNIIES